MARNVQAYQCNNSNDKKCKWDWYLHMLGIMIVLNPVHNSTEIDIANMYVLKQENCEKTIKNKWNKYKCRESNVTL